MLKFKFISDYSISNHVVLQHVSVQVIKKEKQIKLTIDYLFTMDYKQITSLLVS